MMLIGNAPATQTLLSYLLFLFIPVFPPTLELAKNLNNTLPQEGLHSDVKQKLQKRFIFGWLSSKMMVRRYVVVPHKEIFVGRAQLLHLL